MGQGELFSVGKRSRERSPMPAWTHILNHQPHGVPGPGELPPRFLRQSGAMQAGKVSRSNVVPMPGLPISPLMSLNRPHVPSPARVREGT